LPSEETKSPIFKAEDRFVNLSFAVDEKKGSGRSPEQGVQDWPENNLEIMVKSAQHLYLWCCYTGL
jgi:hypothetical protein